MFYYHSWLLLSVYAEAVNVAYYFDVLFILLNSLAILDYRVRLLYVKIEFPIYWGWEGEGYCIFIILHEQTQSNKLYKVGTTDNIEEHRVTL